MDNYNRVFGFRKLLLKVSNYNMLCKISRKMFIKEKNDGRRIDVIEELMV